MFGAASADALLYSTPPQSGGVFFCLASAEGAGLLFCLVAIQPRTSVYSGFYAINELYHRNPKSVYRTLYGRFC